MNILAVIPARYDASRLPGKPLVNLRGRPLVQWVYEAAATCPFFTQIVVATDNELVAERVRSFGGEIEMTRADHLSGTDRVAEVGERHPEMEVVVNVQGDQPFVTAAMLSRLIDPYLSGELPEMTTLACPLDDPRGEPNPNVVKVVCDVQGRALYFSRSPIPYREAGEEITILHHLGLYAFSRNFLLEFSKLPPTPLEKTERLEQLRALEHGYRITVCLTDSSVFEINTPEDCVKAEELLAAAGTP